jgi:16S rRNA (cytidine1402-2'-O)-methyltransferase
MPSVLCGSLYVVATPIGNLSDISPRAAQTLGSVDWVAAEDTRVTRKLLNHLKLGTTCLALHGHNEARISDSLIARLQSGENGALVSDAGTPAISDPGALLVEKAHAAAVPVIILPGPSAPIALLSAAGFAPGPFLFDAFLPQRSGARLERLQQLRRWVDAAAAHLILFESPHRITGSVAAMTEVFGGDRPVALGRELTKLHEEIHRCTLAEAGHWIAADPNRTRGEYVIAIAAARSNVATPLLVGSSSSDEVQTPGFELQSTSMAIIDLLRELMRALPLSQAVKSAEKLSGLRHKDLYRLALTLREAGEDTSA